MTDRPDVILIVTDEERAAPTYESPELTTWRHQHLPGRRWFDEHGVRFERHYTGATACVPSRPTLFTGQYPDVHGVTQTDGLGKTAEDSRMRWLVPDEVPTLGHWFRAGGYDTHFDGKWHCSHADLIDPDTGKPLATNTARGQVIPEAVEAYRKADPLDPFGFNGWIGPEPHGAPMANTGLVRDPLIADRVVRWLQDRYARRLRGDAEAQRPFLLVCCFVNPHDIVMWPAWVRRNPLGPSPSDPPSVAPAPTAAEDLLDKPALQAAYRAAYPSGYGPAALIDRAYQRPGYRETYYRLHAEVDRPIDQVRRAVVAGSPHAVLALTSDHGDLLGSHGGLHQKWACLYDEAVRIPFVVVDTRDGAAGATVADMPTVHVDIVPTLLGAAGLDEAELAPELEAEFSELHPLPGRDLSPLIADPTSLDADRPVYFMTRDNMLEGDSEAPALARARGRRTVPAPLRIQWLAHVGTNIEAVVMRIDGTLWKLVRTFDDPAVWTEPHLRHLAQNGPAGPRYRSTPLPDEWELYDLDTDPTEAVNRWTDPTLDTVRDRARTGLDAERRACVPERHQPRPYAARIAAEDTMPDTPRPPVRALRRILKRVGLHPDDPHPFMGQLPGHRAVIIATNHGILDVGKPTGVFASELTAPYYVFADAGLGVDLASPLGGAIPIDPQSFRGPAQSEYDDRFLGDPIAKDKLMQSLRVDDIDLTDYDIVFFAGGWGAAFDLGFSDVIGKLVTEANAAGRIIGGVCHGPLGLLRAKGTDGRPLVEGRRVSAVTDRQVRQLGITATPQHPETELRRLGAMFECRHHRRRDILANHWVVDANLVTGQNQNAGPMVAREMLNLVAAEPR